MRISDWSSDVCSSDLARTGRKSMTLETTRRRFLVGTGLTAVAATIGLPAFAQDKPTLRFSAVFSEQDIRAEMMKMFADAIKGDFAFEGYYGGTRLEEHTSELQSLKRIPCAAFCVKKK